jgi:hypothetical protein
VTVDDVLKFSSSLAQLSPLAAFVVAGIVVVYVFQRKWLVIGAMYTDLEARLTKTEQQREDAIALAAKLTDILEAGRRGSYRSR